VFQFFHRTTLLARQPLSLADPFPLFVLQATSLIFKQACSLFKERITLFVIQRFSQVALSADLHHAPFTPQPFDHDLKLELCGEFVSFFIYGFWSPFSYFTPLIYWLSIINLVFA